jgi:hypothetical protein
MKKYLMVGMLLLTSPLCFGAKEACGSLSCKDNYLFVQYAPVAHITHNTKNNTYTITLKEIVPYVMYFSERPNRISGGLPVQEFVNLWKTDKPKNFRADPPNADLVTVQTKLLSSTKTINFAIELTSAQYNSRENSITYVVKPLKGNTFTPGSLTMRHVSLFIDDVCLGCW